MSGPVEDPTGGVGVVGPVHRCEVLAELHTWAGDALGLGCAVGEVPVFGSPEWCALADDDPARACAVARAAMAWWADQQTCAQLAAEDHVHASHAISTAHDWSRRATERARRTA